MVQTSVGNFAFVRQMVWPQIFCLAFGSFLSIFKRLAEFLPNVHVVPHSAVPKSKLLLSYA